jgi:signal transduction histidine kinase
MYHVENHSRFFSLTHAPSPLTMNIPPSCEPFPGSQIAIFTRCLLTFKGKVVLGLTAASAILLVVAVLSYLSLLSNAADRRWVTHTHQVLEKLSDVRTNITDAETGERGYILTGDALFLHPYEKGINEVHPNLNALRVLTADNPSQQHALDRLQPLVLVRLAQLAERIEVRRRQGLVAGAIAVREGPGKQLMDQIGAVIEGMKLEEDRLLVSRSAELEASSKKTRAVIVVGEGLGFLFLAIAGWIITKEMNHRKRAEDSIRQLNSELEGKVAERTAQLAERAKDLERSNMELQQFAYVASHDLQEPLRTISSFTQLLAKRYHDKLDDNAREFINFAVDGSKRMQTLINDLLALSRVGTQGKPLQPVDCNTLLDSVLKSLERAIRDTRAVITRDPLPRVMADEVQLGQLFQNLIGNALKFCNQTQPRIHISAAFAGQLCRISVRDNGIGIAPQHKDRIFVIFQRLHTKEEYPGTGIGLAICKKIAERHGGRIWVEPAPAGGSIFFFTLPAATTHTQKEKNPHELQLSSTPD